METTLQEKLSQMEYRIENNITIDTDGSKLNEKLRVAFVAYFANTMIEVKSKY